MAEVAGGAAPGAEHQPSGLSSGLEDAQPAVLTEEASEERGAQGEAARKQAAEEPPARSKCASVSVESSPDQFKIKRFFVLRVKTRQ